MLQRGDSFTWKQRENSKGFAGAGTAITNMEKTERYTKNTSCTLEKKKKTHLHLVFGCQ